MRRNNNVGIYLRRELIEFLPFKLVQNMSSTDIAVASISMKLSFLHISFKLTLTKLPTSITLHLLSLYSRGQIGSAKDKNFKVHRNQPGYI